MKWAVKTGVVNCQVRWELQVGFREELCDLYTHLTAWKHGLEYLDFQCRFEQFAELNLLLQGTETFLEDAAPQ